MKFLFNNNTLTQKPEMDAFEFEALYPYKSYSGYKNSLPSYPASPEFIRWANQNPKEEYEEGVDFKLRYTMQRLPKEPPLLVQAVPLSSKDDEKGGTVEDQIKRQSSKGNNLKELVGKFPDLVEPEAQSGRSNEQEWISVETTPPKESNLHSVNVLLTDGEFYAVGWYAFAAGMWMGVEGLLKNPPTHWIPLPTPPNRTGTAQDKNNEQ